MSKINNIVNIRLIKKDILTLSYTKQYKLQEPNQGIDYESN